MGSGNYSVSDYHTAVEARRSAGVSAFVHTARMEAQPAEARHVSPNLNPMSCVRESRDPAANQEAFPIIVGLDITTSMRHVPQILQAALPDLMANLSVSGAVSHPNVLISAFGDAYDSVRAPLQVGQFEADNRIEKDIGDLWLAGGGGSSSEESSDLLLWFAGHRTRTDHFEVRQQKGLLVLITDEMTYRTIGGDVLRRVFGEAQDTQDPVLLEDNLAQAQRMWDIYVIRPQDTTNARSQSIPSFWRRHLGATHVLGMEKAEDICHVIVGLAGILRGTLSLATLSRLTADPRTLARIRATLDDVRPEAAAVPA